MGKQEKKELTDFEREAIKRLHAGDPVLGEGGIFTELLQRVINKAMDGEMDVHLKSDKEKGNTNRRNGRGKKIVKSSVGKLEITPPRDRTGSFDPQLIKKRENKLGSGIDGIILSLYAKGNSNADISRLLHEMYGLNYSRSAISTITDMVWEEVLQWQRRALSSCYPIVYLDAIHYKIREEGSVQTKAIYTVYGVDAEGQREILGLYVGQNEGANKWGLILEDLKRRGVEEIMFCCVDGLKGFKGAIEHVYPEAIVQRCIVHMVRTSTRFVADKDKKKLCKGLRNIYTSADREQGEFALETFKSNWSKKYPSVAKKWEENWETLTSFMDYGQDIRRMIYTTNPVENVHRIMRKVTKTKGAWVTSKSLQKQLYLTLKYNEKSWKRKAFNWKAIQKELIAKFGDRYSKWLMD